MSFRVVGELSSGWTAPPSSHETADDALAAAIEMMARGLVNVHIVDAAGRRLTAVEFANQTDERPTEMGSRILNDAAHHSHSNDPARN
jgi:hypothetical protein